MRTYIPGTTAATTTTTTTTTTTSRSNITQDLTCDNPKSRAKCSASMGASYVSLSRSAAELAKATQPESLSHDSGTSQADTQSGSFFEAVTFCLLPDSESFMPNFFQNGFHGQAGTRITCFALEAVFLISSIDSRRPD